MGHESFVLPVHTGKCLNACEYPPSLQKASEAILSLEQSCTDLKRELEEDKAQSRHLLTEAVEANRSNSSKLAQRDTELAKTKQHCHDLQTRIESLLLQMQNQMTAYAALKQQLQDAEQNSAEQVPDGGTCVQ